ncbi:MAG: hypothetical protein JW862_18875, partial [Anaerolineales bacterium]|nr:hypothetical protein [Anaerolineales bacterium]
EAILGLKLAGEAGSSLTLALKAYVDQLARLSDLPVTFEWQSEVQTLHIPAETELQLLRIVQEALTNARKHAAASRVWVNLQLDGNLLDVQVRDDGRGFDPQWVSAAQREHYGLESMRQRAEMIGASLHLESQPGAGTRILVQLNLNGS